jgi:hypothetical protein
MSLLPLELDDDWSPLFRCLSFSRCLWFSIALCFSFSVLSLLLSHDENSMAPLVVVVELYDLSVSAEIQKPMDAKHTRLHINLTLNIAGARCAWRVAKGSRVDARPRLRDLMIDALRGCR